MNAGLVKDTLSIQHISLGSVGVMALVDGGKVEKEKICVLVIFVVNSD